ncbi:hypothetical protein [Streptomyces sp. NPDC047070]|uniref:hypothetical protein n=1 Tax=Streptomyces sp. NPDC047070 TaxID=3154923 RepID=UPI003453E65E
MSEQLTRADLAGMSADQIVSAKHKGQLEALLSRPVTASQMLDHIERDNPQKGNTP